VKGFKDKVTISKASFDGRGRLKLSAVAITEFGDTAIKHFPDGCFQVLDEDVRKTCNGFHSHVVAVAPGKVHSVMEFANLASVKLGLEGQRRILTARFSDLLACGLDQQGISIEKSQITVSHVLYFFQALAGSKKLVTVFQDKCSIFQCILGPGELFYLPAGCCPLESVVNETDFIGLRINVVAKSDPKAKAALE